MFVLSKSRSSLMFWPLFPGSLTLLLTPGGPKRSSGNPLHLKIHFSPAIRLFWWDWWWLQYFLYLLTWGPTEMNHVSLAIVYLPSKILHLKPAGLTKTMGICWLRIIYIIHHRVIDGTDDHDQMQDSGEGENLWSGTRNPLCIWRLSLCSRQGFLIDDNDKYTILVKVLIMMKMMIMMNIQRRTMLVRTQQTAWFQSKSIIVKQKNTKCLSQRNKMIATKEKNDCHKEQNDRH